MSKNLTTCQNSIIVSFAELKQKYEKIAAKRSSLSEEVQNLEKQHADIEQISSVVDICLKEIFENEAPLLQKNLEVVQSNAAILQQKSNEYFSRILESKNKIKENCGLSGDGNENEIGFSISKLKLLKNATDQLQKKVEMMKKGINSNYGDLPPVRFFFILLYYDEF